MKYAFLSFLTLKTYTAYEIHLCSLVMEFLSFPFHILELFLKKYTEEYFINIEMNHLL